MHNQSLFKPNESFAVLSRHWTISDLSVAVQRRIYIKLWRVSLGCAVQGSILPCILAGLPKATLEKKALTCIEADLGDS